MGEKCLRDFDCAFTVGDRLAKFYRITEWHKNETIQRPTVLQAEMPIKVREAAGQFPVDTERLK